MSTIIDCTPKGLKIFSYEEDIKKLRLMKDLYIQTDNLFPYFNKRLINDLNEQINHCKKEIENLENS